MLNKYFMAVAIIVLGVAFSQDAFGQLKNHKATAITSPRDVASGQVIDRNKGRSHQQGFSEVADISELFGTYRVVPRGSSLIDTSTGEIAWADEVRSSKGRTRGTNGLINASTGEVVWADFRSPVGKPR